MFLKLIFILNVYCFRALCDSNIRELTSLRQSVGTFVQNVHFSNRPCATIKIERSTEEKVILLPTLEYERHYPNESSQRPNLDLTIFPEEHVPLESIISVEIQDICFLSLCDEPKLLGYCLQLLPYSEAENSTTEDNLDGVLRTGFDIKSFLCVCDSSWLDILRSGRVFDRNLIGVVYSPFDKYWVEKLGSGLEPVPHSNYSYPEILESVRLVATQFSSISATTLGRVHTNEQWDLVALAAAELNIEAGYLAIRLSLRISPENMEQIINGSVTANTIFPGTVWGVTASMGEDLNLNESTEAGEVLKFVGNLKALMHNLKSEVKIGVSFEYEDTVGIPIWKLLLDRGSNVDFIICYHNIRAKHIEVSHDIQKLIAMKQKEFSEMVAEAGNDLLGKRIIFSTGVPSQGVGNNLENSVSNLKEYWFGMADYARKHKRTIHLHEALDQPWKLEMNETEGDILNSTYGPNGTDGHQGWWRRQDNSYPASYLEKIRENEKELGTEGPNENIGDGKAGVNLTKFFVGISVMSAFLIIGLVVYFLGRLKNAAEKNVISSEYVEHFNKGGVNEDKPGDEYYAVAIRLPYDKKHELPKGSFHIETSNIIGCGQSGTVFRGTISDVTGPVAFKCTTSSSSVLDLKNLLSEIKIMSYIGSHQNIVCMLGAYTKKIQDGVVYLALEFCPLGNLEKFLKSLDPKRLFTKRPGEIKSTTKHPNYVSTEVLTGHLPPPIFQQELIEVTKTCCDVQLETFVLWAYQIASAMEFVSAKKVIHADLAARNILLVTENQVKISDFGLSKKLYTQICGGVATHHDKTTPLPWRWMAPESLRELAFSVESDVWSFGVTLWEIFSLVRQVPFQGIQFNEEFVLKLENGLRPLRAPFAPDWIHDQCMACWDVSPSQRPTFSGLKGSFEEISFKFACD